LIYKNLIFDLDGTLWDARSSIVENWNKVLISHNLLEKPLKPEDMNPYMGLLADKVLIELFPGIQEETIQSIMHEIIQNEAKQIKETGGVLYESVKEILPQLAENHKLFIVSNCNKGYINAFLDYFGFHDYFQDFEEYGRTGKPKAENIQLLMKRNQLKPTESVYIGDTFTDYLSAKENDLDFIFCLYGFGKLEEEKVKKIRHFSLLLKYLV
jgi:phosphoglycolate phosphatase